MLIEKTVPKHLLKQMNKVNLSSSDNISSMLLPVNDELPQINQTVQPKMKTDVERKQGESQRQTQRDQSPNQAPSQSHSQHVDLKDEKDSMLPPKYLPNDKMIYGNEIRKHLKHDIRGSFENNFDCIGPPPKQMGVLKAVFRSVYTNYKTPLVLKNNMILIIKIKDFFYYPQKIIAGVLIAGVSVAYIAYKVFMLIDSITTS